MPVSICPRCKQPNPDYAVYCHFDGVILQAQQSAAPLRLPSDFVFPSGRRCRTFDELAQGCQEEWTAARDLLMRGMFAQFFRAANRADLVRAADDAKAQPNQDLALTAFVMALPGTRTQTPKLDLNPRRILLGNVLAGEAKAVPLTVTNRGQGVLQGTITVTEGQDWLSLSDTKKLHEMEVTTAREQALKLNINTKGVAAGQTYGAKLTIVTNGGVAEVPMRMDVVAQPFTKAPFQGARSQREFAEKMRAAPKAAVAILEAGDAQRWFALNGWTYPVSGTPIKGVGGVQQFFEGIGVSKPPPVQVSQAEYRFTCKYKDTARGQVTLQTNAKKWVYAEAASDSPWLKVLTPQVAGPKQAVVSFEVDTNLWNTGPSGDGKITLTANGGQKLTLKVHVDVQGLPAVQKPKPAPTPPVIPTPLQPEPAHPTLVGDAFEMPSLERPWRFVPALVTMVLMCLVLRIIMVPVADLVGRGMFSSWAAERLLGKAPTPESEFAEFGGWLHLNWPRILAGSDDKIAAKVFDPGSNADLAAADFRSYFVRYFVRWFVLTTFWIGGIVGAVAVVRRGGAALDLVWGIIAGAVAGAIVSATVAAVYLAIELVPHVLWTLTLGERGGIGWLLLWSLLAIVCWVIVGVALGVVVPWISPLRRFLINPFQGMIASLFGVLGMKALAEYWTPA